MTMDINDLRTLITTLSFIVFAAIVFWAWSGRQQANFAEAAALPFADEDLDPISAKRDASGSGTQP